MLHGPETGHVPADQLILSQRPAWLLKHSRTCPISAAALDEFTRYLAAHPDDPAGLLVVQDQRPLSNWVAQRLKYTHQSPQLFLLQSGEVLWSASHWSITVEAMAEAVASGRQAGVSSRIHRVVAK